MINPQNFGKFIIFGMKNHLILKQDCCKIGSEGRTSKIVYHTFEAGRNIHPKLIEQKLKKGYVEKKKKKKKITRRVIAAAMRMVTCGPPTGWNKN